MKLIVGLGNPEKNYDGTRHNIGFAMLDAFANNRDVHFAPSKKFYADIAELEEAGEKVILAKPTTFYNLSGQSIRALMDFYKLAPEDIAIVHDELMLPLGSIRTRVGGSDAGNNGIKSINEHIGQNTSRIRIGIYTELRDQMDDADYVISRFSTAERDVLSRLEHIVTGCIDDFLYSRLDATTHQVEA